MKMANYYNMLFLLYGKYEFSILMGWGVSYTHFRKKSSKKSETKIEFYFL